MRRIIVPLVCSTILLASSVTAQQRGFQPQDYYRLVNTGDVQISPAGDLLAFTVTTVVEDENKRHREIWMQRLKDGRPDGEPFRFTDPTRESTSPRWSPDGSVLSFTSQRGDESNSVWFARVTAPGGEAYQIDGVDASPVWSPDGEWIAFTKAPSEDDEESPPRDGWIAPDAITNTLDAERFDGRVVTSLRYKRDGVQTLRPHYSVVEKAELYVVPAAGGEPRRLTDLPFRVGQIVWSADGGTVLFTGNELEDDELNQESTGQIYAVASTGGEVRTLTANPGSETGPAFSPDGSRLAFLRTPERGAQTDLMVVDVAPDGSFRGEPRNLTENWDYRLGGPQWTPDGRNIRWTAGIGGNRHVFDISVGSGEIQQVTTGDRRISSLSTSRDGKITVYTVTDAVTPTEVYIAGADGGDEHRVTSFNDALLSDLSLQPAERLTWTVANGTEIEGWVMKPANYQPGTKYPLILKIHGGPHGAYGNTFFPTFHVLSNSGFFVLYPNPRGSTGYGHDFTYATRGQWGEMDQEDYLKGVDAAVAKYGDIDPSLVGVSGGSYGGYMTNWLTATSDRFSAAVTSRSISNWESWWGSSDAQGLTEYEFYGPPWEQRELYRRLSPISYVENVTAPTLIIHSENDYRTPIGDGEQWFMSLMKQEVPVELVRYPRSSHGLSRTGEPWLLVDRLERLSTWFKHWLIEQRPTTDR
jgi:dipeptidyl aminopeptidase/acylaminoacyl peptidase